jgi:hypothetical protein
MTDAPMIEAPKKIPKRGPLSPDELTERRQKASEKAKATWAIKKAEKERAIRKLHSDLAELRANLAITEARHGALGLCVLNQRERTSLRLAAFEAARLHMDSVTRCFDLVEKKQPFLLAALASLNLPEGVTTLTMSMGQLGNMCAAYLAAVEKKLIRKKTIQAVKRQSRQTTNNGAITASTS